MAHWLLSMTADAQAPSPEIQHLDLVVPQESPLNRLLGAVALVASGR